MAAPDLDTLYRIEPVLDAAIKDMLDEISGLQIALRRDDTASLVTPRVEIETALGDALPHKWTRSGKHLDDRWNFSAEIRIVTDRRDSNQDDSTAGQLDHVDLLGNVRAALAQFATHAAFNNANLPYHNVLDLRHAGTSYAIEGDLDVTALQYAGMVSIIASAWPA